MKKKLLPLFFLLPTLSAFGQVDNYCLRLNPEGSVDCGCMPELDQMQNYSLQFWMNADEWTDQAMLLSRGEQLQVRLGGAHQLALTLGNETVVVENAQLVPQKWLQCTLIVEDGSARFLLNGKEVLKQQGDFALPNESQSFVIGNSFAGRLDELRIWNAALQGDFDYFVHNTLNKWVPQLDHLVAYYKFDQEQCPHIVDYKALFSSAEYNHHGVMTAEKVQRELVKDNTGLPYLLCGGYTNVNRFFDRGIDREKFLLANDLIILGIQSFPNGHLKYAAPCDHATLGEGVQQLTEFEGRTGVMAFSGKGGLTTTTDVLTPALDSNGKATKGYTFETWLYLDRWTPGAYLFKKMTADGKGFAIRLGEEATHQVIVDVNGNSYVCLSPLTTGKWTHLAVSTQGGSTGDQVFLFAYDGVAVAADADLSSSSTDFTPKGMDQCVATIGEGLEGKLDETVVWNEKYDVEGIQRHMAGIELPALGKSMVASAFLNSSACYLYDQPEQPGWDSFSMDEWKNRMVAAYKGYRGYQVRISVSGHKGWQNTISDAAKRKIFAKDLAKLSEGYDGVELDLEWMDGPQTHLGNLAREIRNALPKEKSFRVSCHAYGAYKFPAKDMTLVDGFTFQQYGPQKTWFTLASFKDSYNNFVKYGFPKDKIYLSFASTTSGPYNNADQKQKGGISGWRRIVQENGYSPSSNMGFRKGKVGDLNYYYQSPEQVYQRAKFVVENQLQGIFYWDIGNDIATEETYSLAKYCNYALSSNVDTLVTEVKVNAPTTIEDVAAGYGKMAVLYEAGGQTVTVTGGQRVVSVTVYNLAGQQVAAAAGATAQVGKLRKGAYLVVPTTVAGTLPALKFLKK